MAKNEKVKEIQSLRKELSELITAQVIPKRERLDSLLNEQAELICPFKINDIITLNNNKKGIITEIKYYSIDYDFNENTEENDFYSNFVNTLDEIEYKYAYSVDTKDFTITWCISGFRMKNNDKEIGKISFRDITPVNYLVDIKNKSVKEKPLNAYMGSEDLFQFNEIK